MIVEIIHFDLPKGTDRTGALALYRQTAEKWRINPDLIEKYYVFDTRSGRGSGVHIRPSREAAARWHGPDDRRMVASLYGSQPHIKIHDALIHVAPQDGRVIEL